jgi:hypothetical protein
MVNRLSWAAWKTSLACSTFSSHLNTDHTCDLPETRRYSSYKMVQWTSDLASKCVIVQQWAALLSACMQYNNVGVRLYTGNISDTSDDTAILWQKLHLRAEAMFCNTWRKVMIRHWPLIVTKMTLLYLLKTVRPEENDCKYHNMYLYQILWGRSKSKAQ